MTPVGRSEWQRAFRVAHAVEEGGRVEPKRQLTTAALAVGFALSTYANSDGTSIHPGVEKLRWLGLNESTVIRALTELRRLEWIERVAAGNRRSGKADVYRLTVPPGVGASHAPEPVTQDARHAPEPVTRPRLVPVPVMEAGKTLPETSVTGSSATPQQATTTTSNTSTSSPLTPEQVAGREPAAEDPWLAVEQELAAEREPSNTGSRFARLAAL